MCYTKKDERDIYTYEERDRWNYKGECSVLQSDCEGVCQRYSYLNYVAVMFRMFRDILEV